MKWLKNLQKHKNEKESKSNITSQMRESYPLCIEILEHKLDEKDMLFENYEGERVLQILMTEKEIIDVWRENKELSFIETSEGEKDIEQMIEHMKQKTTIINQRVSEFRKVEKALREEIINFTNIVREMGQRYKLSPTWEGKKPILIEKQKQLEAKRRSYDKAEEEINEQLLSFYKEYQKMQSFFYINAKQYIEYHDIK